MEKESKIITHISYRNGDIVTLPINDISKEDFEKEIKIAKSRAEELITRAQNNAKEINKILDMLSGEVSKIGQQLDGLKNYSDVQVEASKKVTQAVEKLLAETGA